MFVLAIALMVSGIILAVVAGLGRDPVFVAKLYRIKHLFAMIAILDFVLYIISMGFSWAMLILCAVAVVVAIV